MTRVHFQNAEVNVYNLWRRMLEEQEKIAKTRLENAKTLQDEVQKDAKALRQERESKDHCIRDYDLEQITH